MKKLIGFILSTVLYAQLLAGNGYYAAFKLTSNGSNVAVNGEMKIYSDEDGNSRSEINMAMPNAPMGNMNIVSIHHQSTPNLVFIINDAAKTYSKTDISKYAANKPAADDSKYEIKIIGDETVNGYKSQHIKVFRDNQELEDMWFTKEISDYGRFDMSSSKYNPDNALLAAMKAKGIEGMMVRVVVDANGGKMQMDLVKFEKRDNANSLFSIPADYKEVDMMNGMLKQMNMPSTDEIMKMTPEERERFLKEMQSKYK